jgi:hypothetical protein
MNSLQQCICRSVTSRRFLRLWQEFQKPLADLKPGRDAGRVLGGRRE